MSDIYTTESPTPSRHRVVNSVVTNASGVADSTISFGLSEFPRPPLSIPVSPAIPGFPPSVGDRASPLTPSSGAPSLYQVPFLQTVPLRLRPPGNAALFNSIANDQRLPPRNPLPPVPNPNTPSASVGSATPSDSLSPFDWHEGSSSIDVDPNDVNLLPTSFITSLLSPEPSGSGSPHSDRFPGIQSMHSHNNGDAMSGISEVTYPSVTYSYPPRPQMVGTRMPPGAAYWEEGRRSCSSNNTRDSETIQSAAEHVQPNVLRVVDVSRMGARGASVIGMASAVRVTSSAGSSTTSDHRSAQSSRPLLQSFQTNPPIEEDYAGEQKNNPNVSHSMRSTHPTNSPVSTYQQRQSSSSSKTVRSRMSSLIKRISRGSSRSRRESKPLPPVPGFPDHLKSRVSEYYKQEEALPLPLLASRADALSRMLDKGHIPHSSVNITWSGPSTKPRDIVPGPLKAREWDEKGSPSKQEHPPNSVWRWSRDGKPQRLASEIGPLGDLGSSNSPSKTIGSKMTRFGWVRVSLVIGGLIVIVVVAVIIGVVVGRKKHSSSVTCPQNTVGATCDLDSTCVCPSSSDICVANILITLTPIVNQQFDANLTTQDVAAALWNTQGAPLNGNCGGQAMLVDVGSTLRAELFPNRTTWARSALLWQLVQTVDLTSVAKLQSFVNHTDFSSLSQDGPVADSSPKFRITNAGFTFDFAAQTVSEPAVSWESAGKPSSSQMSQAGSISSGALDRMYSLAFASSIQQQEALSTYWQFSLHQDPENLSKFMSIVSASPIVIPFDATLIIGMQALDALLTNTTNQFPPPIACYPSLIPSQLERINQVEQGTFGLSPASMQLNYNTSCYGDRPVYGVLDVLRLRLPFSDSRSNVSKQGAVLIGDVSPRAVVYSGEVLSALPHDPTNASAIVTSRQVGTLNNFNHVMLRYLSSIPDINVAIAFVQQILSSPVLPPSNASTLFDSLSSLPALEVALFGDITASDVSFVVSSFSTPSGGLFFGSDASQSLRNWAIGGTNSSVAWAEFSTSPEVVHDTSFDDALFNSVWNPAFEFMHTNNPGIFVNVSNITSSFQAIGKFSP